MFHIVKDSKMLHDTFNLLAGLYSPKKVLANTLLGTLFDDCEVELLVTPSELGGCP